MSASWGLRCLVFPRPSIGCFVARKIHHSETAASSGGCEDSRKDRALFVVLSSSVCCEVHTSAMLPSTSGMRGAAEKQLADPWLPASLPLLAVSRVAMALDSVPQQAAAGEAVQLGTVQAEWKTS
jgi:hypothetical protein